MANINCHKTFLLTVSHSLKQSFWGQRQLNKLSACFTCKKTLGSTSGIAWSPEYHEEQPLSTKSYYITGCGPQTNPKHFLIFSNEIIYKINFRENYYWWHWKEKGHFISLVLFWLSTWIFTIFNILLQLKNTQHLLAFSQKKWFEEPIHELFFSYGVIFCR